MDKQEIALIDESAIATVFTTEDGADLIIEQIKKEATKEVFDVSTAKGRENIKSMAYKVARSKTALDNAGKDLVADWKSKAALVDADRRKIRDALDDLKEQVRKPLTEYEEAEEARIAAEKLAKEIQEAHALALEENALIDRQAEIERKEAEIAAKEEADRLKREEAERKAKEKEEAERLAKEQQEREAKAAKEAENRAKKEAEEKLKAAEEQRIREKIEAEAAQKAAVKAAEDKAKAEAERVERERLAAEQAERERVEAERVAAAKKAANKKHRAKINNDILSTLVEAAGINEAQGREIIAEIAKGNIPHVSISY